MSILFIIFLCSLSSKTTCRDCWCKSNHRVQIINLKQTP
nr:MAG TPA: hypothetical protein [Caudoviricetes sp.]